MSFKKGLSCAVPVLFILCNQSSFASVSIFGVGVNDSPSTSNLTSSFGSKFNAGVGGLEFGFNVAPMFAIEIAPMFFNRQFTASSVTISEPIFSLPVGLRVWLAPWIGIGAGGFYNVGTGQITETQGSVSANGYFGDAGVTQQDYGAYGSVRVNVPVGSFAIFADARYNLGLSNDVLTPAANAGGSLKYNDLVVMVGLTFGMDGMRR